MEAEICHKTYKLLEHPRVITYQSQDMSISIKWKHGISASIV